MGQRILQIIYEKGVPAINQSLGAIGNFMFVAWLPRSEPRSPEALSLLSPVDGTPLPPSVSPALRFDLRPSILERKIINFHSRVASETQSFALILQLTLTRASTVRGTTS
jgi:hypothetical protein